jgi:hypothetical protein
LFWASQKMLQILPFFRPKPDVFGQPRGIPANPASSPSLVWSSKLCTTLWAYHLSVSCSPKVTISVVENSNRVL